MSELFRGLATDSNGKHWEYGGVNSNKTLIMRQSIATSVDPETVSEFTGVYDCKFAPIYEGDIVDLPTGVYGLIVKTMGDTMGFYYQLANKTLLPLHGDWIDNTYIAQCKVIGNKYTGGGNND